MGFVWIWPVASSWSAWGWPPDSGPANVFKLAPTVLVVIGVGGMVNFIDGAARDPGSTSTTLLVANNLLPDDRLHLALFIIGLGLYQGRSGFVPDEESAG